MYSQQLAQQMRPRTACASAGSIQRRAKTYIGRIGMHADNETRTSF